MISAEPWTPETKMDGIKRLPTTEGDAKEGDMLCRGLGANKQHVFLVPKQIFEDNFAEVRHDDVVEYAFVRTPRSGPRVIYQKFQHEGVNDNGASM
jgi:hypothetical protein